MKTLTTTILSLFIMLTGFSASGQSKSTASATASVVVPISITKVSDMSFGNVAVSASTGGSVVLNTAGLRTTGGAGGVTLPATAGTVAAAAFTISGAPGFTYAISLPSACTLADGGGHTVSVGSFISTPSLSGTLSSSGSQNLLVSATMSVTAAQPAGTYTNAGGVPVTVNYN